MAECADLLAPFSSLHQDQAHHQKALMHIYPCTPFIHHFQAHLSRSFHFLFSSHLSAATSKGGCLFLYSVFFVLLRSVLTDGATWSGSSRHLSTVSNARSGTVYCWSSFLWNVATLILL